MEISLAHLREAIKGKYGCVEEVVSEDAAKDFLQRVVAESLRVEDLQEEDLLGEEQVREETEPRL